MNLFERLFRSKKKKEYRNREYEEAAAKTRYADLEKPPVNQEFHRPEEYPSSYDIVELCEQMIDVSRELEGTRAEYQQVTDYLNDIQTLEDMSPAQKAPILEAATRIANLEKERSEYLDRKSKLTDSQFSQMQAEEDELPGVIKRLTSNETYLDAIKKDLSYLEGEKLMWAMQKTNAKKQQKFLRKMSVIVFLIFATMIALSLVLGLYIEQDTKVPMLVTAALAAILSVFILIRYQDAAHGIKRADVNRNHAVTMENRVKIKYVNIKNAVDYTYAKYHVSASRDLIRIYELYQEEIAKQKRFLKNNDELERYSQELLAALQAEHLYDARLWQSHAVAIIEPKEMVELKHELLVNRQKLRTRIEYNLNTLAEMKQDVARHVQQMGASAPQVKQIITKLEEINASL